MNKNLKIILIILGIILGWSAFGFLVAGYYLAGIIFGIISALSLIRGLKRNSFPQYSKESNNNALSQLPPKRIKLNYTSTLNQNAYNVFQEIKVSKKLPSVDSPLMLPEGETAHFIEGNSHLSEVKNVTHRTSGGMGMRVAKGVYLGGSQSESRSSSEIQAIDSGTIILTNKNLFFKGGMNVRTIPLSKIISVDILKSGFRSFDIALSVLGSQKKEFVSVKNPFLWQEAIKFLKFMNEKNQSIENIDINMV